MAPAHKLRDAFVHEHNKITWLLLLDIYYYPKSLGNFEFYF